MILVTTNLPRFDVECFKVNINHELEAFQTIHITNMIDTLKYYITNISYKIYTGLSGVRSIKMDYNQLKDIPLPPISCTNFSLAHNNIAKIKGRRPWPIMNSLRFLNLDYNQLEDNIETGR